MADLAEVAAAVWAALVVVLGCLVTAAGGDLCGDPAENVTWVSAPEAHILVTQEWFETSPGLVAGVIYNVTVRSARVDAAGTVRLRASAGVLLDAPQQLARCSAGELLLQLAAGAATVGWVLRRAGEDTALHLRAVLLWKDGSAQTLAFNTSVLADCLLQLRPGIVSLTQTAVPRTADCYIVRPPAAGRRQSARLTKLSVRGSPGRCQRSFLQLTDVRWRGRLREAADRHRNASDALHKLCGKPVPGRAVSVATNQSNALSLFTHRAGDGGAFLFHVTFFDSGACADSELPGPTGRRTVDAASLQCQLRLHLPLGYRARLSLSMRQNVSVVLSLRDGTGEYNRTVRRPTALVTAANRASLHLSPGGRPGPGPGPVLELSWSAEPADNATATCGWPWSAHAGWCYHLDLEPVDWERAAAACAARDALLVTVSHPDTERFLTMVLADRVTPESGGGFWSGATDRRYQGTFRWPDGRALSDEHAALWRLAEQQQPAAAGRRERPARCLQLQLTPDGDTLTGRSRPCSDRLRYICRRPATTELTGVKCNQTHHLNETSGQVTVTSPGRADRYSSDLTCITEVTAPPGARIELTFSRFILEEDESCDFDSVTVLDDGRPTGRFCGDWSARLKQLRRVSSDSRLLLVFVTDYLNEFPGFEALLRLVREERLCTTAEICYMIVRSPAVPHSSINDTCGRHKGVAVNSTTVRQLAAARLLGAGSFWVQSAASVPAAGHCDRVDISQSQRVTERRLDCHLPAATVCRLLNDDQWQWPAVLSSPERRLSTPGFPAGYRPLLRLQTTLHGPAGSRLAVRLLQVQLEPQPACLYDALTVTWPPDGHVTLCGRHDEREVIYPLSNVATVAFTSDWAISGPGASFSWSAIDVSRCSGEILSSVEGTISSPGYPHLLPTPQDCTTYLLAPGDTHLLVHVVELGLPCDHSWLEVAGVTGPGAPATETRRLCGHQGALLLAPGPYVRLHLHTDEQLTTGTGYRLTYTAVSAVDERVSVSVVPGEPAQRLRPVLLLGPLQYQLSHRMAAPPGANVVLKLTFHGSLEDTRCTNGAAFVQIRDEYAPGGGASWWLCAGGSRRTATIRSYLHVLTVTEVRGPAPRRRRRQRRRRFSSAAEPLDLTVLYSAAPDVSFNNKSSKLEGPVENCSLNPCVNAGKCTRRHNNFVCVCLPQYVGQFCHIPACELSPCLFGTCETSAVGVRCHCDALHHGDRCELRRSLCDGNPCRGRGLCTEANDTFVCHCHGWWSGRHCETRLLHIPYKPLSERMIEEPFWLGLITVTVVMVVIGIIWCIKKHFAERIEHFFAEEIEKSKYYGGYIPSPCTSHALLRESPAVSPQPQRSLLQRLSLRKTSRVSLLSLSSVASSPGHDLRRSVEDFFRAPLGRRRSRSPLSPCYKRNSSGESHELDAESRGILRGLVTPRDPLAERSRSYEEFIQLAEMKMEDRRKLGSQSVDEATGLADTSFHDIMDSKFDKRVKFASLMSHVSRDMMTSSGSDLSCAGDASSTYKPQSLLGSRSRRSLSFKRRGRAQACLPTDDTVETTSTGSDLTPDAVRRSALIQSLSTPSSPRHRPIAKITSADSILSMLRGWANGRSVSTPSSPANSDHGDEAPPSAGAAQLGASGGGPAEKSSAAGANSLEIPVYAGGSGKNGGAAAPQSVTLEIPSHDYRCLSPITEVPTPSPSPLPTPIRMTRRPIHIHLEHRVSDLDSDASTSFSMSGNEQSRTSSASLDAHDTSNRTPSPTLNRKYSCNFPIPMVIIETTHTSPDESDEPPLSSPPLSTSWPSPPAIVISEEDNDTENSPPAPRATPDISVPVPSFTFLAASPTDEAPLMPLPSPGERKLSAPHALSMLRRAPCLQEASRADSLELQPQPVRRLTRNMSEQDSDTDSTKQTAGLLLAPLAPNGAHSTSESNLSSSGYSSAYSPAPSRCSSINPLLEEGGVALRRPVLLHQATLEDDSALGSNDDCLSTDPEMPRQGEPPVPPPPPPPPQIVIHPPAPLPSDSSLEEPQRPSPASSRSESPLSDRTGRRFSRQFFGKLELPATDSDCLYDYPSSERLTATGGGGGGPRRAGRRRRRGAVKWRSVPTVPPQRAASPSAERQKAWAAQTHRRRANQPRSEVWTSSNESLDVTRSAPVGDCKELYQESSESDVSSTRSVSSGRRHRRRIRRQGSLDTSDDQNAPDCSVSGRSGRRNSRFRALATQLRSLRRLRKPRPAAVAGSTSSEEPPAEPDERSALLTTSGRTLTHSCSDPCEYIH